MRITPCKCCGGQRLKKESLAVTVSGKNIYEITAMSIRNLDAYLKEMELTEQQHLIGDQVLKEIRARVGFLMDVGLDYLSLSRATGTLIRWRSTANPTCNPDWFRTCRRGLYSGRA